MDTSREIKILFSQAHNEQLCITNDTKESESQFSTLRNALESWGYVVDSTIEVLMPDSLAEVHILVVGAPRKNSSQTDLSTEFEVIKQFVANGGGLLLIANGETMINPPPGLNRLAAIAGLQFQEYLNYPPTFLQSFWPHYITANLDRIQVGKVASLNISGPARSLAFTRATKQGVMACANVERGRLVAIGDVDWLADHLLNLESNRVLAEQTFRWLAGLNIVDVKTLAIPKEVEWGQTVPVTLELHNSDGQVRPQIESVLESDADAFIESARKNNRSLPPGGSTLMRWNVRPQILGSQQLRLTLRVDNTTLFFDQLPEMLCQAPGYFTLEIKDTAGKLKTAFHTGDKFTVKGAFHWAAGLEPPLPSYELKLQLSDGLVQRGYEPGEGVSCWHLQATASGEHNLTLSLLGKIAIAPDSPMRLAETGQSLLALVTVTASADDRLGEIKAAYVYPLEAEIAERLKQIDGSLSHTEIRNKPFNILTPEDFVKEVYKGEAALWLQGVLAAARREQWYNLELLDLVLTYIAPTYLPDYGAFIPYDPGLASHLAELHPKNRKRLEYNLLCAEESEDITIKQNVAAYLLHEKFGHGFFYTQTRLGQQLAILSRHEILEADKDVVKLIEDSAIIVNEGFAAWLELTFLAMLDREVRQAVELRRIFLIQEASGLYGLERKSDFFQAFSPRFDSRYREGYEYLDYISRTFNLRCTIRLFLIATNIDFGIRADTQGILQKLDVVEIKNRLLDPAKSDWRSHFRLRDIANMLYQYEEEAKLLIRHRYCPGDCRQNGCPLEAFIAEKLHWRVI